MASMAMRQRGAVALLCIAGAVCVIVLAARWTVWLPVPASGQHQPPLHVDLNSDPVEMISLLPEIGETRAATIVAYREKYLAAHGGAVAFRGPADLMQVRGIGPSILEKVKPHLIFHSPATQPR